MVTRIGLVVALACVAMPATLMGTTYFFINENPDYSDSLAAAGEEPLWQAEIIEVESDSEIDAPSGYEETDTAYIHSMGLLAPSELVLGSGPGVYKDWHTDLWHNRYWGSIITTSYAGPLKRVQVNSTTGRYAPGIVAVNDSTICPQLQGGGWFPGWYSAWGWYVQWAKSWSYGDTKTWTQIGWHNWNSGDFLRTHVGPITW
jgi:hypothetical protein